MSILQWFQVIWQVFSEKKLKKELLVKKEKKLNPHRKKFPRFTTIIITAG